MTDLPRSQSASTGLPLSSVPENSREGRRFLQDRVALFGRTMFLISLSFLASDNIFYLLFHQPDFRRCMSRTPMLWHAGATAVLLAQWLLARPWKTPRGTWRPSPSTLMVIDVAGLFLVCALFSGMAGSVEIHMLSVEPDAAGKGTLVGLSANGLILLARAVLIPMRASRALLVSALACLPGLTVAFLAAPVEPAGMRAMHWVSALLWCVAYVTLATVCSRVVYGLRERVREARQLGQYTLEERVGEGGMGQVYRASHAMLRRPTAVKLLPPDRVTPAQLRRFEREVQLTAILTHPNTISVYDYGRTPDGIFYYAMEFLEGFNLGQLVERDGPQSPARVIHVLRQACGALGEAHAVGLIHRDVKPANVFLCERGGQPDFVKVLDFGLVKQLGGPKNDGATIGGADVITGTPLYMAPESIREGGLTDARSDLYALGAVAYFLLSGRAVFTGRTVVEVCAGHLHEQPRPLSEVLEGVPRDLEALVLTCLAKDPRERPQSARELDTALAACAASGAWSEIEARAWWERHRDAVVRDTVPDPSPDAEPAHAATIEVDLSRRPAMASPLPAE